ncbi:MAG TPA: CbtB-domain containing protein [Mesorhizobium sp.]|jgi:cobalt transporter subunit CbtB|nr:CbtB-domain containing protein [Mesorhizobium sp.]
MFKSAFAVQAAVFAPSRLLPLVLAAGLGFFVTGFVGLAPMDAVHAAAHDYRHAMGFPCH